MTAHARVLDRHRFARLRGDDGAGLLGAVEAYRNPDGGYGWGLEPDLRSVTSQPGAALHALEAFADAGPATTPRAAELCDWLDGVSLPDGGLPFALPIPDPAACAPFWVSADPGVSSLQITAAVAGQAHRVAAHDPAVAAHPWLARATAYCLAAIDAIDGPPTRSCCGSPSSCSARWAMTRRPRRPPRRARSAGRRGARRGRAGGRGHAAAGLRAAARPSGPRALRGRRDRRRAGPPRRRPRDDGGWTVDFDSHSPQAALEWRGYATVRAVTILLAEGRA